MKKQNLTLWGFVLFPLSLLLLFATVWLGMLYTLLRLPIAFSFRALLERWNHYFFVLAVSIDQFGNVVMQDLFHDLLLTKKAQHFFGDEDETISSVLGRNKEMQTLSKMGLLLANFLDWLDPNHVLNSIEHRD